MSDEMAAKVEEEVKEQKVEQTKEQEEAQKRLHMLQIIYDPVSGQVGLVPNDNIKTMHHITAALSAAFEHHRARLTAKYVLSDMDLRNAQIQTAGKKPKLFGPK